MFNLPSKLRADLHSIEARVEEAIRQDERHKLLQRMAAEYKDRNGEQTVSRVKRPKPNSKLGRLHGCLASRTYGVNRDTLVRLSGMTPVSVHQGIQQLRQRGYTIECNRQGTKPKYKLVA